MEYKGKLYGKIGGIYFDTSKTADKVDALSKALNDIVALLNEKDDKVTQKLNSLEHEIHLTAIEALQIFNKSLTWKKTQT